MVKIVHLTSAHPRYDKRIFIKECKSLADAGYDISIIVADGLPDEIKDKIKIYGVQKAKNRLFRILKSPGAVYKKALILDADIYHLHDPELLPIGLKLRKKGKKVIFDSHEDNPAHMLEKPYLNKTLSRIISGLLAFYEKITLKKLDWIVAATPFIRDKISNWYPFVTDINNYVRIEEFDVIRCQKQWDMDFICYMGLISELSGIKQVIRSLEYCKANVRLKLAGSFSPLVLRDEIMKYKGWEKVDELGILDRGSVKEVFKDSFVGLSLYLPSPNTINAKPTKMFEYMAAGLPVIASNFPLWKEIIEKNDCGICVDPADPREIALAIDYLATNPDKAFEMGQNGKKAVIAKYNWKNEAEKLLELYQNISIEK